MLRKILLSIIFLAITTTIGYANYDIDLQVSDWKTNISASENTYTLTPNTQYHIGIHVTDPDNSWFAVRDATPYLNSSPDFAIQDGVFYNCEKAEWSELCSKLPSNLDKVPWWYASALQIKDINATIDIIVWSTKKTIQIKVNDEEEQQEIIPKETVKIEDVTVWIDGLEGKSLILLALLLIVWSTVLMFTIKRNS